MRTESALLFGDGHTNCPSCNNEVHLNMDTSLFDEQNRFNGWQCPFCESLFNKHDEIIYLGSTNEEIGFA